MAIGLHRCAFCGHAVDLHNSKDLPNGSLIDLAVERQRACNALARHHRDLAARRLIAPRVLHGLHHAARRAHRFDRRDRRHAVLARLQRAHLPRAIERWRRKRRDGLNGLRPRTPLKARSREHRVLARFDRLAAAHQRAIDPTGLLHAEHDFAVLHREARVRHSPLRMLCSGAPFVGAKVRHGEHAVFVRATSADRDLDRVFAFFCDVDRGVANWHVVRTEHADREVAARLQVDLRFRDACDDLDSGSVGRRAFGLRDQRVGTKGQVADLDAAVFELAHATLDVEARLHAEHRHHERFLGPLARQQLELRLRDRLAFERHAHMQRRHRRQRDEHVAQRRLRLGQHPRILRRTARCRSRAATAKAQRRDATILVGAAHATREVDGDHRARRRRDHFCANDRLARRIDDLDRDLFAFAQAQLADIARLPRFKLDRLLQRRHELVVHRRDHVHARSHADETERAIGAAARHRERQLLVDLLHPRWEVDDLHRRVLLADQQATLWIESLHRNEVQRLARNVGGHHERARDRIAFFVEHRAGRDGCVVEHDVAEVEHFAGTRRARQHLVRRRIRADAREHQIEALRPHAVHHERAVVGSHDFSRDVARLFRRQLSERIEAWTKDRVDGAAIDAHSASGLRLLLVIDDATLEAAHRRADLGVVFDARFGDCHRLSPRRCVRRLRRLLLARLRLCLIRVRDDDRRIGRLWRSRCVGAELPRRECDRRDSGEADEEQSVALHPETPREGFGRSRRRGLPTRCFCQRAVGGQRDRESDSLLRHIASAASTRA